MKKPNQPKPESVLESMMHKILLYFEVQMVHPIPSRRPDLVSNNTKKRTHYFANIVISKDHRVKMKENEMIDKYQDLARDLEMLDSLKEMVIPIVVVALETVPLETVSSATQQ